MMGTNEMVGVSSGRRWRGGDPTASTRPLKNKIRRVPSIEAQYFIEQDDSDNEDDKNEIKVRSFETRRKHSDMTEVPLLRYNTVQSKHLPRWMWQFLNLILGIRPGSECYGRNCVSMFLFLTTVLVAGLFGVTNALYIVYEARASSSTRNTMYSFLLIVVGSAFISISLYSYKRARHLLQHPRIISDFRLHSKSIIGMNATFLLYLLCSAFISINLYDVSHLTDSSECGKINLPDIICPLAFYSRLAFYIFSMLWNFVIVAIVMSVTRTQTIGLRKFIKVLDVDAQLIELTFCKQMRSDYDLGEEDTCPSLPDMQPLIHAADTDNVTAGDRGDGGDSNLFTWEDSLLDHVMLARESAITEVIQNTSIAGSISQRHSLLSSPARSSILEMDDENADGVEHLETIVEQQIGITPSSENNDVPKQVDDVLLSHSCDGINGISRVDEVTDGVNEVGDRVDEVGDRVDEVGERVDEMGDRVDEVGERVDEVGERVDEVGDRVDEVGERVDEVGERVDEVGDTVTTGDDADPILEYIMSPEEILLSYWKLTSRLRIISLSSQRWLSAWVVLILTWVSLYLLYWLANYADAYDLLQFILPLVTLAILCSSFSEVNMEGGRIMKSVCPRSERYDILYYMDTTKPEMTAYGFSVTYAKIVEVFMALALAIASRIIFDSLAFSSPPTPTTTISPSSTTPYTS